MACKIIYKDGKPVSAIAPNGKPSILFNEILKLPEVNNDGEAAFRLYAQPYTSQFKDQFGNWEIISKALQYKDDIKGMYQAMFEIDPQAVLHEVAVQLNSQQAGRVENVTKAVAETFPMGIQDAAISLFPTATFGESYQPVVTIPLDENGEPTPAIYLSQDIETNPTLDKELFDKILNLLNELYPEIKLTIAKNPKWEAGEDIFNQMLNDSESNTNIFRLSQGVKKAEHAFELISAKNKNAINTTAFVLIEGDPLRYLTVDNRGQVYLKADVLAKDIRKELGDQIIPEASVKEAQAFNDKMHETESLKSEFEDYKKTLEDARKFYQDTLDKVTNLEGKSAEELFNTLVNTNTYYKNKNVYQTFDLRGKDGNVFGFMYENGQPRDGDGVVLQIRKDTQFGKSITYEAIDDNEDLQIEAQLALQEFKKNPERIKKAISVLLEDPLQKDVDRYTEKLNQEDLQEEFNRMMIDSRYESTQMNEHDIIEWGIERLVRDNLMANGIINEHSELSRAFGFTPDDLLEKTRNVQYEDLKKKQKRINYILGHKEEFNNEYDDLEQDSDILAPIPGWFLNAVSVANTGKYFDEHKGYAAGMIKGVIYLDAQKQYDDLHDSGETPRFQILADTRDLNSLLTDKIVLAKPFDFSEDAVILNQTEDGNIIGQANVKAMTVLIDAVLQKQDTLPHEYAHHYIAWFRNSPLVQEGIKRFGSEEALVDAIGKEVVNQNGEAYDWWKKFVNFILSLLSDKQVLQLLTDSFLTRKDLNATDTNLLDSSEYTSASSKLTSSKASEPTLNEIRKFLETIGIRPEDIKTVSEIIHNGQPISALAMADAVNRSMQIVEGKENVTLPEEAMHFLVRLIKVNRPKLYEALMNGIRDYKIYKELLNSPEYTTNPLYRLDNGGLNIEKLKEEAVAKVIAELLIDGLEGDTEKPHLIQKAGGWWKDIVDWIMSFFGKYSNPFSDVITDLLAGNYDVFGDVSDLQRVNDNGIFLSAAGTTVAEQDARFQNNKTLFNTIKDRTEQLNISKVNEKYYINGEEGKRRVSDLVEAYYNDLFKNKIIPEEMKPFYEKTRLHGTYIHEIMQDILNRLIDPATGLIRDKMGPQAPEIASNPLYGTYEMLAKHIVKRLSAYKEGTRFLVEQIIYDPNKKIFGTVDFIAIDPDTNAIDILDWKTIQFEEYTKNTGVREYKEEAFNIQIKEYKRILKDAYGAEKFGKLRAIPIKKIYRVVKDANGVPTNERKLYQIQIGAADPKEITEESLKPVIVKDESTGNRKLDNFINILEKVAEDLKGRVKNMTGKFDAGLYELVKKSIYDLRVSQDLSNFYQHSKIELTTIKNLLDNIQKNKHNYSNEAINNALGELNYYYNLLESLEKVSFLLRDSVLTDKDTANLNRLVGSYEEAREQIDDIRKELADNVARNFGIFNLLKPEKVMHFWSRFMRNMSQSQSSAIQLLYKLVAKVYNRIELKARDEEKALLDKREGVAQWAKRNNKTLQQAVENLLQVDKNGNWTGNLISTIDSKFYEERTQMLKSEDRNAKLRWWAENYDLNAYARWYNEEFSRYQEEVKITTYSVEPNENANTKKYLLERFEKRYNIMKHPDTALGSHNTQVWSKNMQTSKWYSSKYQFLLKPENKELLDAYNHFTSINKELVEAGVIEAWREHTFIPNVRKGFAETFAFEQGGFFKKTKEGLKAWGHDFYESLTVTDQQMNYAGYINPLTGERENKLFALYVTEISNWVQDANGKSRLSFEDKSKDLFTVYSLMNRQKNRYNYMKDVEDIAQSLKHIEATKGSIETSKFGAVQKDAQDQAKISEDNTQNLEILEKHIRGIVYGEHIQNDADVAIEVSWNKFATWWNKSWLGSLKKLKTVDKEKKRSVSASKLLMRLNNMNVKRVLGINLASAISNLFGGTASTFLINKQLFTDKDLAEAGTQMISGSWYASEDMRKRAALVDYFLPLLDNRHDFHAYQLSDSDTVRILSQDWIMAPMRRSEEIVQMNIFLAVINNTMVENGELVNIRKYVQDKRGWAARYNMTQDGRKALEEVIETEIEQLKKEKSIIKTSTFSKQKRGGKEVNIVTIPGLDRNSQTVEDFRERIHAITNTVLGSTSEFNLAAYKYNMWARLFMTFKNWMPRQLDVRFGEFRYDSATDQYEWGRARMFYRAFSTQVLKSIVKLIPFVGRGVSRFEDKTYLVERAKQIYQEKIEAQRALGLYNEEQFMKEDEFIQSFIQGVDAEFTEFRTVFILLAIFASALLAPGDDDDDETKNAKRKILRQVDKLTDELSFFYSPQSLIDVMGSKPLPVMGFMGDAWKLITQTNKEIFGQVFQNDKWVDSAKPTKYLFKLAPVTKELLGYMPILAPDMAKDMGVTIQTQNRN